MVFRSTRDELPIIFNANYSLKINSFHVMNGTSCSGIPIISYPNIIWCLIKLVNTNSANILVFMNIL
jgi:hypothetical protein